MSMLENFPVDAVPDGAVFAPHHYIYAMALSLLMVFVVWDNFNDREPLYTATALGVGLFGFLFVWQYYPAPGAILSLIGPLLAILFILMGWVGLSIGGVWDDYPLKFRLLTIFFALVALDDAVEHAFDIWTPLDWFWESFLIDYFTEAILFGVGIVVVAIAYAIVRE